ncbi:MAG TPA: ParB/RepB/Spo0J family partition protein, partial [Parvularculaceae bacterium]|nr:ParB/RepB/Spo0J family partition protein [Parvularculaceae bacterium]
MSLQIIPLERLKISALNMRASRKKPVLDDILPSIRERGVLVPLLVRPNGEEGAYEIVAGRRRYLAAKEIENETGEARALPCHILAAGDDAAAIEASLLENVARLEPGEMQEYEAYKALHDKGRSIEDIARIFGVAERAVRRRLALANLLPAIRKIFAEDEIDGATAAALTLASESKQREWLGLFRSKETRAPRGGDLKRWLLGGGEIATGAALFPLDSYDGDIFEDLFGERSVFADAGCFWKHQDAAVEAEREKLLASGWSKVTLLKRGEPFSRWDFDQASRKDGGEVFIETRHSGEVEIHKGYAPRRKPTPAKSQPGAARPECSAPMENYVDLHRHAAARAMLLRHRGLALRLLAAHLIIGAPNIQCAPDPQRTRREETAASLAASIGQRHFEKERAGIAALLGLADEPPMITGGNGDGWRLAEVFAQLMKLSDDDIARILAFIMAEAIASGHEAVDCLPHVLALDIGAWMKPDEAFFDLLRDRKIASAMLAEIAGSEVANANADEPLKVQKAILRDCLAGR